MAQFFPLELFSNTAIRKALHRPLADPGSGHLKQIFTLPPLAPASPEIDKTYLMFPNNYIFIRIFFFFILFSSNRNRNPRSFWILDTLGGYVPYSVENAFLDPPMTSSRLGSCPPTPKSNPPPLIPGQTVCSRG